MSRKARRSPSPLRACQAFRCELCGVGYVDVAVGGVVVGLVAAAKVVGVGGEDGLDDECQFAVEGGADLGGAVVEGADVEAVGGGVVVGVVAAVLVELVGDAAQFAGPAPEGGDLGEVDEFGGEFGEEVGDARVGGADEGFGVLPGDACVFERLEEGGKFVDEADGCGDDRVGVGEGGVGGCGVPARGLVAGFAFADLAAVDVGDEAGAGGLALGLFGGPRGDLLECGVVEGWLGVGGVRRVSHVANVVERAFAQQVKSGLFPGFSSCFSGRGGGFAERVIAVN